MLTQAGTKRRSVAAGMLLWALSLAGALGPQAAQAQAPAAAEAQQLVQAGRQALAQGEDYETGGPLAGVKLPLYQTQHGELPGHPGSVPKLNLSTEDLAPEWELYPGSVEHWRTYWFKYCQARSFFDRQSLVKQWVAPAIPNLGAAQQYEAPLYWVPRHDPVKNTGLKDQAVAVQAMKAGGPKVELDLGQLPVGMYALRIIAAVPTEALRPFRKTLLVGMSVNDGVEGQVSNYRMRCGYVDEFYSVAELYFHAPQARAYQAKLWIESPSEVAILVHNINLDDALAGVTQRPIKNRRTVLAAAQVKKPSALSKEERLQRDAAIWKRFPPLNAQGDGTEFVQASSHIIFPTQVKLGADGKPLAKLNEELGAWESGLKLPKDFPLPAGVAPEDVYIFNGKQKLIYTVADLRANKPLPDPYPYKDDGCGLVYVDAEDGGKGMVFSPIATETRQRIANWMHYWAQNTLDRGEEDALHDAVVAMACWAYHFPSLDGWRYLSSIVRDPAAYGRDYGGRRRMDYATYYYHYASYVSVLDGYDRLFEYMQKQPEIAQSVGRFIPWVKTSQDLVQLFDSYWVQTTAKRVMRYHYYTDPMAMAQLATLLGDTGATSSWMEWLFARTFIYPMPAAGIQDSMITASGREGQQYIASTYYAQDEGADRVAVALGDYLDAGGSKAFDLSDQARYPKPVSHLYWRIANVIGGGDFLRIGDVCGPDKTPGHTLVDLNFARYGWKWTKDPVFAYIVNHFAGREQESDADWAAIQAASAKVPRAPWLDNPSRVLPNWASILEGGVGLADPRRHTAAAVRVGFGWGHHHDDTFDLQVVGYGLPMTIDGGQRPGYSSPGDRMSRIHNTVEVDGESYRDHSWARTLFDDPTAGYTLVQAAGPKGVKLFARQVAMINVDPGKGGDDLPPAMQRTRVKIDAQVEPAQAYVFDVFRVSGGKEHTYCFHGPINREAKVVSEGDFVWNVAGERQVKTDKEGAAGSVEQYLSPFKVLPELNFAGAAPADLEATWRYKREKATGSEQLMLGANYDPAAPAKFTRLHLLGVAGDQALRGEFYCTKWDYQFTCLMVRRQGEKDLDSAYAAIIEPYAGTPILKAQRLLEIPDNDSDAARAVAVSVQTVNGHDDVCFSDLHEQKVRQIPQAKMSISGEYAYHSTDKDGLRQAALVGGTLLQSPLVRLEPAARQHQANVIKVDYLKRQMWLDQPLPARATSSVLEVGVPGHQTSYTATAMTKAEKGTLVQLSLGADFLRSRITKLDAAKGEVEVALEPILTYSQSNHKNWVASDESMTQFWRADFVGARRFQLRGGPVSEAAFGKEGVLRLWEYGVGDAIRQSTSVSLRRVEGGAFELRSNVAVKVALPGAAVEISADNKTWAKAASKAGAGGMALVELPAAPDQPVYLRVVK